MTLIKRPAAGFLPLLFLLAVQGASPGQVQEQLREAIRLPMLNIGIRFGFDVSGLESWDPVVDPAGEAFRLERQMAERPDNAAGWLELARLQRLAGNTNEARHSEEKAVTRRRQELADRPDDARAMAALAAALPAAQYAEAERLLHAAVARDPKDWKCELELARLLSLHKDLEFLAPDSSRDGRPDEEFLKRATVRVTEAGVHFDRAVELGPRELDPRLSRIAFHFLKVTVIEAATGISADPERRGRELAPDLQVASELSPDDFRILAMKIGFLSLTQPPDDRSEGMNLSSESRREVLDTLARLDRLAEKAGSPEKTAAILEARAILQYLLLGDTAGASENSRRSLQLQPGRPRAWALRFGTLLDQNDDAAVRLFLEETLRRTNTALVNLCLAKVEWRQKRPEKAAERVRAALDLEPELLAARAAEAAIRLQQARTEEELAAVAGRLSAAMKSADEVADPSERANLIEHLWTTAAICAGLSGDWKSAHWILGEVASKYPKGPYLLAVGEILELAPRE